MRAAPLAALLAATAALSIAVWPAQTLPGDPVAAREEARGLLLRGRLEVDPPPPAALAEAGQYYYQDPRTGAWRSKYGVMNAVSFLPALAAERLLTGELPARTSSSRLLFLNALQTLYTLALAGTLYGLAVEAGVSAAAAALFSFGCLFGTCLWYYARAQSAELFQALLFTGFCWALLRRSLAGCWALLAALSLTKVSHLLFVPLTAVLCLSEELGPRGAAARRRAARACALGAAGALLLVGAVHWAKFGSVFTTGYGQWRRQWDNEIAPGGFRGGLAGFLLDPQRSVLLHFPPLLGAAAGAGLCWRRRRDVALVCAVLFAAAYLSMGALPFWRGEWSYGPRYLMFVLPVAALPCAFFLDEALKRRRVAALALSAAVLGACAWAQWQVNALDFFAFYRLKPFISAYGDDALRRRFENANFSLVNAALRRGRGDLENVWFLRDYRRTAPPEAADALKTEMARLLAEPNLYWAR